MRSFISISSVNRIMSAYRSRQREKERAELISSQNGSKKELPPTFSLKKIDFNPQSRVVKIEILQSQRYRTVDRYVTRDYVRYPVFSDWKMREKTIKKSIKLTNSALETLNRHEDPLIRQLSIEIIEGLNREELFPSWFVIHFLREEWQESVRVAVNAKDNFINEKKRQIDERTAMISDAEASIQRQEQILKKQLAKKEKIDRKITKIETAKPSVFLAIVTFGIRAYLISNRRKRRLSEKRSCLERIISSARSAIEQLKKKIASAKEKIEINEGTISDKEKEVQRTLRKLADEYSKKIQEVPSLPVSVDREADFVLLKTISGMEYEKIIGCYIIRNRENKKVYVGQSKDVLKRLRQHFRGTVPNNIIFAEDFYSSAWVNKDDLFEVKIIPCSTKDELDRTERELIETYDAFTNGYNGTNGNK